jgi:site-specific DNA-cytosine methylase
MIKHGTIIPLIGGLTLGSDMAFGRLSEELISFKPFYGNDRHLINYYEKNLGAKVPYVVLDDGGKPSKLDVVGSVCPCAGLSQLSHGYGTSNQNNKWLIKTTQYVLTEMSPEVFWGENAPGFAGNIGKDIRERMRAIAHDAGYAMSVYSTKSILHGMPQVRSRAFFFFWKGDRCPELSYFSREHEKIEDTILSAGRSNFQTTPINGKIPSRDPYYRFVLEHMYGGISHLEFFNLVPSAKIRNNDIVSFIEKTHAYPEIAEWMGSNGYPKERDRCLRRHEKLQAGGSIMRRGTIVPKGHIGAFVGHYPTMLTHPHQDRYISYREAMTIMNLPLDFELLDPEKSVNHICQNVPVSTARDMALEVRAYLEGRRNMINSSYVFQHNASKSLDDMDDIKSNLEIFL